jgi:hypothetical protein
MRQRRRTPEQPKQLSSCSIAAVTGFMAVTYAAITSQITVAVAVDG